MGSLEGKIQPVKVLLDTNIILDVALERQPFFEASEQVLAFAEQGQITGYISASTFGCTMSSAKIKVESLPLAS